MNFEHCLHIGLVIRKLTDASRRDFSGGERGPGRRGYVGKSFHVELCIGEENFS